MRRIPARLIDRFKELGITLALGESVTCGYAAHELNTVKGTLDVLKGSMVCYHPETKIKALHIRKNLIQKHTAESQQVTDAMAKNLNRLFTANVYAASTGLATSNGTETKIKPVGTIYYSVLYKNKIYKLRKVFRGTPLEIKKKACQELYLFILRVIA